MRAARRVLLLGDGALAAGGAPHGEDLNIPASHVLMVPFERLERRGGRGELDARLPAGPALVVHEDLDAVGRDAQLVEEGAYVLHTRTVRQAAQLDRARSHVSRAAAAATGGGGGGGTHDSRRLLRGAAAREIVVAAAAQRACVRLRGGPPPLVVPERSPTSALRLLEPGCARRGSCARGRLCAAGAVRPGGALGRVSPQRGAATPDPMRLLRLVRARRAARRAANAAFLKRPSWDGCKGAADGWRRLVHAPAALMRQSS
mmetsp:Transcript_20473/g.64657  ORF Transcript_20473/g.64657 Transcript_20473/m.64657 type:complete len:260 (+) Transcript_20473:946-1725(+)